jgi:hypothetical protein
MWEINMATKVSDFRNEIEAIGSPESLEEGYALIAEAIASITVSQATVINTVFTNELQELGADLLEDARETLFGWCELSAWAEMCARLEAQLEKAGLREFQAGVQFEAIYEATARYACAMFVMSLSKFGRRVEALSALDVTELSRPLTLMLPTLKLIELPNVQVQNVPIFQLTSKSRSASAANVAAQQQALFRFVVGIDGQPISSLTKKEWLSARRAGVTASDARKLVKLNGSPSVQITQLLATKLDSTPPFDYPSYAHGREREPIIAKWVEAEFGIVHNLRLVHGLNSRHLATPDGLGTDCIAEIKTSTKPLLKAKSVYRDQLQWQLHVTGAKKLLFVVENRDSLVREYEWVYPDQQRIATLVVHANLLLGKMDLYEARKQEMHAEADAVKALVISDVLSIATAAPKAKSPTGAVIPTSSRATASRLATHSKVVKRADLPSGRPHRVNSFNRAWVWLFIAIIMAIFLVQGFAARLPEGNGYEVTCNDGWVSHSGGLQGACSHHNGEVIP